MDGRQRRRERAGAGDAALPLTAAGRKGPSADRSSASILTPQRAVLLEIDNQLVSAGGYEMPKKVYQVVKVEFPKSLQFMSQGSLLSVSGAASEISVAAHGMWQACSWTSAGDRISYSVFLQKSREYKSRNSTGSTMIFLAAQIPDGAQRQAAGGK